MSAGSGLVLLSRYDELREDLLSGRFDPSRLPELKGLIVDAGHRRQVDGMAELSAGAAFTAAARHHLYALLMQDEPNAELLYHYLADGTERRIRQAENDAARPFDDWGWAYLAEAAVVAHEHTGDPRFLDIIDATFPSVLRARDSERGQVDQIRGRALKSWVVTRAVKDRWTNVVTTPGRIGLPVCRFVEKRKREPGPARAPMSSDGTATFAQSKKRSRSSKRTIAKPRMAKAITSDA